MTPKQVKDTAVKASLKKDYELAMTACDEITERNLYIGERMPVSGDIVFTFINYGPKRCNTCGKIVHHVMAWWVAGFGTWHKECDFPWAQLINAWEEEAQIQAQIQAQGLTS